MASLVSLLTKPVRIVVGALSIVLSSWSYRLLFAVSSLLFGYALLFFTSLPGQSIHSWWFSVSGTVKLFVPMAAVLLGLTTAVQVYVWRHVHAGKLYHLKHSGVSLAAFVSAILSTACCSPFLLTLVGLVGFGSLLATHQEQFIALALVLLLLSLYYSSKVLSCEDCKIKLGARWK